jgi:hypothetical protein
VLLSHRRVSLYWNMFQSHNQLKGILIVLPTTLIEEKFRTAQGRLNVEKLWLGTHAWRLGPRSREREGTGRGSPSTAKGVRGYNPGKKIKFYQKKSSILMHFGMRNKQNSMVA